jgi:nucleoid DNA-binding protein
MGKKEFTKRYARQNGSTSAQAADQIDRVIDDLLHRLRSGHTASLPGFGILQPAKSSRVPTTKKAPR